MTTVRFTYPHPHYGDLAIEAFLSFEDGWVVECLVVRNDRDHSIDLDADDVVAAKKMALELIEWRMRTI